MELAFSLPIKLDRTVDMNENSGKLGTFIQRNPRLTDKFLTP